MSKGGAKKFPGKHNKGENFKGEHHWWRKPLKGKSKRENKNRGKPERKKKV